MTTFLQLVFSGIASGAIYAILGLALVMIYRSTSLVNFAQGEMATFSTYVAWTLISVGLPFWVAAVGTVILSFLFGSLIETYVVRPVSGRSTLGVVAVFIGLFMIFNSLAAWIWTPSIKTFPSPFPEDLLPATSFVSAHELGLLCVTFVILIAVYVFFRFTSLGLAMRAVAQNQSSSSLVGIRVGRMLSLGWGISAAIGSVAGIMVAPIVFLDPNMMLGVIIYGFAAALLGGINNPFGAVIGGFIVGILETLLGNYITGSELKLSIALLIIVGVLVVKPSGLFSRRTVARV
ncbi:MAG: branched-chain amino acid ABC transporter permease [Alphaproteobacteria bacterium]